MNVLPGNGDLLERSVAPLGELLRSRLDERLGRRRAGREPDRDVAVEQRGVERRLAVDERGGRTSCLRDPDEPYPVRARLPAAHEDERRVPRPHTLSAG